MAEEEPIEEPGKGVPINPKWLDTSNAEDYSLNRKWWKSLTEEQKIAVTDYWVSGGPKPSIPPPSLQ